MGHNDRYDSETLEMEKYLRSILEHLEPTAQGITRFAIDNGIDALSDKQKYVFQRQVADCYIREECKLCHGEILWEEMSEALDNGGYCSHCAHLLNKDD